VTVEITEALEEVVPMEAKTNSQRLVVRVAIHVLGETIRVARWGSPATATRRSSKRSG